MTDVGEKANARVIFEIEVIDGWPPVSSERLWAFSLGDDIYRIDNAPWFVRDLAIGDLVEARASAPNEHPVFQRIVQRSDHSTIRLVVFRGGPLGGDLRAAVDLFRPLNVYAETAEQYGMVALDVPPEAPLDQIHRKLLAGANDGSWDIDASRVSSAWPS